MAFERDVLRTQLIELVHDVTTSVDHQKQIERISKAFNSVSHLKLIRKLELTSGTGPILDSINDYLTNRSHFVEIKNEKSVTADVTSGIPQASVLARVLFLIFINGLPASIFNIRRFADDCVPYQEINSAIDHIALNNAVAAVTKW